MEYLKTISKSLYIGFLDYEKAFDFINRANIIKHLTEKGAGSRFTKAIASMYDETSYIPKVCNRIADEIVAITGRTEDIDLSSEEPSETVAESLKEEIEESVVINVESSDPGRLGLSDDIVENADENEEVAVEPQEENQE